MILFPTLNAERERERERNTEEHTRIEREMECHKEVFTLYKPSFMFSLSERVLGFLKDSDLVGWVGGLETQYGGCSDVDTKWVRPFSCYVLNSCLHPKNN